MLGMMVIVLLAIATAACSDSNDGNEEPAAATPKLLSFGFYAEDNQGILSTDYVAASVASEAVTIAMPSMVDKSHLVARFTTNEGNTVLVDGITQESGKTANDYTVPVDFIVSNGTQNAKYTVTITKASNMAWIQLPTYTDASVYSGAVLKVNPTDNVPYIAYKNSETNKMAVIKFEGDAWKAVGTAGFSTEVASSHYAFDFDTEGTPYVAYSDDEAAKISGATSMMKWNGSAWEYVGNQDFVDAQSQKIRLAVTGKDQATVTQINNSRQASFLRRALVASSYNGSWNSAEPFPGATFVNSLLAKNQTDVYLFTLNLSYQYAIYRYNAGSWEPVLSNFIEPGATGTAIVGMQLIALNDGTLYVMTGDDATTEGVYIPRLKKYDPESKQWSTVGGNSLNFVTNNMSRSFSASVAIAPDGTPFIAYRDDIDQSTPKVAYLDNETKQWSTPVKIEDTKADDVNIAFTSTGVGYITFTDAENHLHTYKYAEK